MNRTYYGCIRASAALDALDRRHSHVLVRGEESDADGCPRALGSKAIDVNGGLDSREDIGGWGGWYGGQCK
jgi:hypothetical protein